MSECNYCYDSGYIPKTEGDPEDKIICTHCEIGKATLRGFLRGANKSQQSDDLLIALGNIYNCGSIKKAEQIAKAAIKKGQS